MFPVVQKKQLNKHNCQFLQSTFKFRMILKMKYIDTFSCFIALKIRLLISVLSDKSLATDLILTLKMFFYGHWKSGTI